MTSGGSTGGGGMAGGTPQPAKPNPTGFGGIAAGLGLGNNYSASAAPTDYTARNGGSMTGGSQMGFGNGGYLGDQAGQSANDVTQGKLTFGGNGAYNDNTRTAADYARASQQIGANGFGLDQAMAVANNARQQGLDAAAQQQMALAKSGNPMQGGMAAYGAQQQGAQMGQQAVQQGIQQSAQMKQAYDQMALQGAIANRQMNLGLLGQSQQQQQFGAGYGLQAGGMNQDLYKYLMGLQQGYAGQSQQGQEGYAQLASNNYNTAQGINSGISAQQGKVGGQLLSGMASAAAAGAAA